MAKNVQGVIFLRNGRLYDNRQEALDRINLAATNVGDGEAILARYTAEDTTVKTIVGFKYVGASASSLTLIDVEGLIGNAKALVDALRAEIEAKLGVGVTSANTATAQFEALSGNAQSTSAETSVAGAKAYAFDLIGTLDFTDTAETGSYVSKVDQTDGIIRTTKVELPSSADTAEAKKVVIAVSEDKGQIEVSRGTISSSAETIVLGDTADGGVNFEVNIDGETIVQDETSKKLKVADSALTQYFGDEKTIHAEIDAINNKKIFNTLLALSSITPSSEIVKEEFALQNASGETLGTTIKIYKDSHIVSITYITSGEHAQNLEYVYIDASGNTQTTYVDMSELVLETEFASGVTVTDHIAHGVVDPTSEKDSQETPVDFLTVGADGFKVSGIKDEINRKLNAVVEDLDATVTGATSGNHITISIEEVDGKLVQSGLTIAEDNIASATDLAELSAKTITNITSTNASIDVATANTANDTVEVDVTTDASKIKMSGFTSTTASSLNNIAASGSVVEAFEETDRVITENERITSAALNDLNNKIETVSATSETAISGVSVNNIVVPKANKVADIQISGSTAAPSGTVNDPAIIVNTDQNTGAITLGIGYIDCGTYDD